MCTRFIHNGRDMITGFNFDIDLAVWTHKIFCGEDKFCIDILVNGAFHSFHGVNANGNAATLLYVPVLEAGKYRRSPNCYRIDLLSERFIKNEFSFDEAVRLAGEKKFVNVPGCSMQAMLSDSCGRSLLVEPGAGFRMEEGRYSLVTNYSLIDPERTRKNIIPGDDRYERAKALLNDTTDAFTVSDALFILNEVRQEGAWATRVSFVYSANENAVYYVINNDFENVMKHCFIRPGKE